MANKKRLDLISRKALIAEYDRVHIGPPGGARKLMEDAPTVDAVEVVHARWENGHCTNCTHYAEVQNIGFSCTGEVKVNYKHTNYCPNCGAKMDGGDEDG